MRKTSRQLGFPAETEKLRSRETYKNKKRIKVKAEKGKGSTVEEAYFGMIESRN